MVLSVKNLSVSYGGIYAVKNVSFDVFGGEYVCVVGENGSGKSTLVKTIMGLIEPSGGSAQLMVPTCDAAYLAQSTLGATSFPATVGEVVLSGTQKRRGGLPFYNSNDHYSAQMAMEKAGIADLKKRGISTLSGGQYRRVLIARALCRAPKLFVLDEPFAGLDYKHSNELYELYAHLNQKHNITIVMVSHDIEATRKYATRVLTMERGSLISDERQGRAQ